MEAMKCDVCGVEVQEYEIIAPDTEYEMYVCKDCADYKEAQQLNMAEDDYYDCRPF